MPAHTGTRVAFADYREVLYRAAALFTPGQRIVLFADRGFCDVELLLALKKLGWHYRIRVKQSLTVYTSRTTQRLPGRTDAAKTWSGTFCPSGHAHLSLHRAGTSCPGLSRRRSTYP
ncbi:transposase [Chloroflexus aggregans]|uniref:transposase n=1 Tax=Chloroflexus aggregans TaxID=152260 RepID=UPI0012ED03D8